VAALSSYLLLILAFLAERRGAFRGLAHGVKHRSAGLATPAVFVTALLALPLLLAAQLRIADHLAAHPLARTFAAHLPVPVVDEFIGHYGRRYFTLRAAESHALVALACLEAFALGCVYLNLCAEAGRGRRILVGLVSATMALITLAPHALSSGDAYAYVGYALLGIPAGYQPPGTPLAASFDAIGLVWNPLPSSVYGPLWMVFVHGVTMHATTLLAKIEALRVVGVCAIGALALALRCCGFNAAILALVVVNPVLFNQYAVNAHNDILPVVLVVFAFAAVRRYPALAALLVTAAGLMKLPFVAFGALAFTSIEGRALRLMATGGTALAVLVLSTTWAGTVYFRSITGVVHDREGHYAVLQTVIAIVVALSILLTLLRRPRPASTIFAFPAIGTLPYAWYLLWGLPYALTDRRLLAVFLVALPVAEVFLDLTIFTLEEKVVVALALILAFLRATQAETANRKTLQESMP